MHSFTIALVSTLSLGVHAASIGDSVSQIVTREQHNRLFHNPDFTTANLPATESFERAGKISPRQVAGSAAAGGGVFSGAFATGFNGQNNVLLSPQTVDAQTATINGQNNAALSAQTVNAQAATINGPNNTPLSPQTVDPQAATINGQNNTPLSPQTVNTQAVTINGQNNITPSAQTANTQAATINSQNNIAPSAQAATNNAVTNPQVNAQSAQTAQVVNIDTPLMFNDIAQALNPAAPQSAPNRPNLFGLASAPLFGSNPGIVTSNGLIVNTVGARQDLQPDAMKRQLPALPVVVPTFSTPAAPTLSTLPSGLAAREDNPRFFDDQVEDMDFSAHNSEADELEEGF